MKRIPIIICACLLGAIGLAYVTGDLKFQSEPTLEQRVSYLEARVNSIDRERIAEIPRKVPTIIDLNKEVIK